MRRDVIGMVIGGRRVLADMPSVRTQSGKLRRMVRCICVTCGHVLSMQLVSLSRRNASCRLCAEADRLRAADDARRVLDASESRRGVFASSGRLAPDVWRTDGRIGRVSMERRRRAVIELVGLTGPMTLEEVAALLGVSRQCVHQIEHRARAKIAARAERFGLEAPTGRDGWTYPDHGEAA